MRASMNTDSVDIRTSRVAAILNTASGSCGAGSEEEIRSLLSAAGITTVKIWCGDGSTIEQAFTEAKEYTPDVLIVLGGDGTIRAGAEACTPEGPYLIALPGGTMNMLPKALYGNGTWQEVLTATLARPSIKSISGGSVGGRQFFIAAIVGAPTLWATAREALREGDFGAVVEKGMHAFANMLSLKLTYSFSNDVRGEAEALSIICPLISDALKDAERALEAAVIDASSAGAVLELASAATFGAWRESTHVITTKTREITISAEEDIPLILDGETMDLGKTLDIRFVPGAFKALIPNPDTST